jgi:hypothetical protein
MKCFWHPIMNHPIFLKVLHSTLRSFSQPVSSTGSALTTGAVAALALFTPTSDLGRDYVTHTT